MTEPVTKNVGERKAKKKKTDKLRSIEDNRIRYGLSIRLLCLCNHCVSLDEAKISVKHVPQCLSGSAAFV